MKRKARLRVPPEDRKLPQRPKAEIRSELSALPGDFPVEKGKPAGRPTTLWMRSKGWKGSEQEATVFVRTERNCEPANGWGRKAIIPKGMACQHLIEPRKLADGTRVLITAEERSVWAALRAAEWKPGATPMGTQPCALGRLVKKLT